MTTTDTQPKGETLLPCPWCEVPPEVCKAAGYGFTVECVNEVCQVGPALSVTRGRANAIKAWNTRRAAVTGPQGETDTTYNLGEITELRKELIGTVERERLQKASPWVRSLVNELVQRIYNLRHIAQTKTVITIGCDYRENECSAEGVTVGGRWICNNHAATSSPTPADPRCIHCQHGVDDFNAVTGLCEFDPEPENESAGFCGCKCEFAPAESTRVEGEHG